MSGTPISCISGRDLHDPKIWPSKGDVLVSGPKLRVVLAVYLYRCGDKIEEQHSRVTYWSDRFALGIESRTCSLRAWRRYASDEKSRALGCAPVVKVIRVAINRKRLT